MPPFRNIFNMVSKDNTTEERNPATEEESAQCLVDTDKAAAVAVNFDFNHNESNTNENATPGDENGNKPSPAETGWKRYAGIIFALMSGVCFTLASLIVKLMHQYHPLNFMIWRFFAFVIPMVPAYFYLVYKKERLIHKSVWPVFVGKGEESKWKMMGFVVISAIFACSTFQLRFFALKFMTLADATVIAFSGPVCVVILAHFCLKEKCGIVTIPIALWTLLGVFIIARPPLLTGQAEFSTENLIGIALSLVSVFFVACYFIIMRKLREVHLVIISLMGGFVGIAQSVILVAALGVFRPPDNLKDIMLMAAMSLLSFVGQMTIVAALKFEAAGTISLFRTSDVLFAFAWQLIFLQVVPDLYSLLGALIVVIGVSLTTFRSWLNTLPEKHRTRKLFRFLLY